MPVPSLALTLWQFDLTWSLFEYHLERLEPEDFRWEPDAHCRTMRVGPTAPANPMADRMATSSTHWRQLLAQRGELGHGQV